ncbi:MAG: EH signature domain-containing protein, partial [Deltaproteobacteria bacterium]|nr:EH signature domain-containing protein [Deltaproteobacteria bacterium]
MFEDTEHSLTELKHFLKAQIIRLEKQDFSDFHNIAVSFKAKLRKILLASSDTKDDSKTTDLIKKWNDFKNKKIELSTRELTRMCGVPEILGDKEFLELLLSRKINIASLITQRRLLRAYLQKHRTLSANEKLHKFLTKNLEYLFATVELEVKDFIGREAPNLLAAKLVSSKNYSQFTEIFDRLRIEPFFLEFFAEFLKSLAERMIENIANLRKTDVRFLIHDIIWNDSIDLHVKAELTTKVIKAVKDQSSNVETVRDAILELDKLGDPRIHGHNWSYYSLEEARQIFVSWLSERDLKFFFDFVFAN